MVKQQNKQSEDDEPKTKSEFSNTGQILIPAPSNGNDFEGLRYSRIVWRDMRDKIARSEHVSLGRLLNEPDQPETSAQQAKHRKLDMKQPGYLSQNVPSSEEPIPMNIKSKLELFNRLFMFGSYYLQKFPEKTASFFDYLMFLMEQGNRLNLKGLIYLDHYMREEFATHPEWNWGQHRPESNFSIQRVALSQEFVMQPMNRPMAPGATSSRNSYGGYKQNNYKTPPSSTDGINKRKRTGGATKEAVKHEACMYWNNDHCKKGKDCWRRHVCLICKKITGLLIVPKEKAIKNINNM